MANNRVMLWLGAVAALHVFLFSAAFPFFNVVDEQVHLDLVIRYSQADIPRTLTPPAAETLPFVAIYGTPEYINLPSALPGGVVPPPPWKMPIDTVRDRLIAKENAYQSQFKNQEASQPPLYYTVAGLWWQSGKLLGLDGGRLLYWLRFLNILFMVALVWVGRRAAIQVFPENKFIQLAVPAIIALMPQTVFYSINNDMLSPVLFGLVFVCLLKFQEGGLTSPRLGLALGLALAGTFLTKISNLPLLAVTGAFLGWQMVRLVRQQKLSAAGPALAILAASALLPMAAWMTWCKINFGDLTGSSLKIRFLNWTDQPFSQWFHHPIFTPAGLWTFVSDNLSTFWQGEFLWHRLPLTMPGLNGFYVFLTLLLLIIAAIGLFKRSSALTTSQRMAMGFGFACVVAMFAFFALLSVKYDFQDCFYPSRVHPYFTSGRLMLGMLVPFLLLFALGLDRLLGKVSGRLKFTVLGLLLLFMLGSEVMVDWKFFPNAYNWFHL